MCGLNLRTKTVIKRNDSVFTDKIDTAKANEAASFLRDKYGGKYCLIPTKVLVRLLHIVATADIMPSREGFGLAFAKALKAGGHDYDVVSAAIKELGGQ